MSSPASPTARPQPAAARRPWTAEDGAATVVGLAVVALGLLSLLPEWLARV